MGWVGLGALAPYPTPPTYSRKSVEKKALIATPLPTKDIIDASNISYAFLSMFLELINYHGHIIISKETLSQNST